MKLSILIPVYNVEKYLRKCLDSVTCCQGKGNEVEIIIIDDGSTDNSIDIIKEYDVKYVSRVNKGLVYTRKELFKMATGDYCFCVDSDDYLCPNAIQRIFELIEQADFPDILFIDECNDYNGNLKYSHNSSNSLEKKNIEDVRTAFSLSKINNNLWNKVFKRELISDIEFIEEEKCVFAAEDLLFTSMIMNKAKTVVYANEVLYVYRRGLHRKTDITRIMSMYKSISYVYNYLKCNYIYYNDNRENWLGRYLIAVESMFKMMAHIYDKKEKQIYKDFLKEIKNSSLFVEAKGCRKSFIIWAIRNGFGFGVLKLTQLLIK